jgi:hypothetical protein
MDFSEVQNVYVEVSKPVRSSVGKVDEEKHVISGAKRVFIWNSQFRRSSECLHISGGGAEIVRCRSKRLKCL